MRKWERASTTEAVRCTVSLMALGDQLGALASGMSVDDAIERYLASLAQPAPVEPSARAQSEAIVEIMFLIAAVDGRVADEELDLLQKNVRELTEVDVLKVDADGLVPRLVERLGNEGWSARMKSASSRVVTPDLQRLAYRLGAGVAFVDDCVEAAEADALESLAKTFGLRDEEAQAILVEVQKTLFG